MKLLGTCTITPAFKQSVLISIKVWPVNYRQYESIDTPVVDALRIALAQVALERTHAIRDAAATRKGVRHGNVHS